MKKFYALSGAVVCFVSILLLINRELTKNTLAKHKEKATKTNVIKEFISMRENDPIINNSIENKVVVINLWATWCGPCKREIPELNAVARQYGKDSDEIIFIAITDEPEGITKSFLEKEKFVFQQVYNGKDLQEYFQKLNNAFPVNSIPLSIIINKEGKAELFLRGYSEENIKTLKNYLSKIITQPVTKLE